MIPELSDGRLESRVRRGDLPGALEELEREVLSADSGTADPLLDRAAVLLRLGDREGARRDLQRALKKLVETPRPAQAARCYRLLASLELAGRNPRDAETYLRKANEGAPEGSPPAARLELAFLAVQLTLAKGDAGEAGRLLEGASALADSPRARAAAGVLRARLHGLEGDAPAAVEAAQAALRESKAAGDLLTVLEAQDALSGALVATGRTPEAVAVVEEAFRHIESCAGALPEEKRFLFMNVDPQRSLAMRRSRIYSHLTRHVGLEKLTEVIQAINAEVELKPLMELILDALLATCHAESGFLFVEEGAGPPWHLARGDGVEEGYSRSILKKVIAGGTPIQTSDAHQHPEFREVPSVRSLRHRSILCLPLRLRGRSIGAVYLASPVSAGAFTDDEQAMAMLLCDQAAVAIDKAILYQRSIHDPLTGLCNHGHFERRLREEVRRAERHGRPLGVLIMDLDHFKLVNDTHGHEVGSRVLRDFAALLSACLRVEDVAATPGNETGGAIVGRYGGDEFEVILPEANRAGALVVAERILKVLREHTFEAGDVRIQATASIGVASCPEDAADPEALLRKADEALYEAKRAGRNRAAAPAAGAPESLPDDELDRALLSKTGRDVVAMISRVLDRADDLDEALRQALEAAVRVTRAERGFVLMQGSSGDFRFRAAHRMSDAEVGEDPRELSSSIVREVLASGQEALVRDATADPKVRGLESVRRLSLKSILCVPIRRGPKAIGAVYLDSSSSGSAFQEADVAVLRMFAARVGRILDVSRTAHDRAEEIQRLERRLEETSRDAGSRYRYTEIIGRSPAIQKVLRLVDRVVESKFPVLIQGETGTGKELIARAIHYNGPRKERSLISVNCGAVSDTLLESELFGHVKGAFTGADKDRDGLFALADGGTLFLDEVEEMSDAMQAKLLRVLEDGILRPVGARQERKVDVRVVAATNTALDELVEHGEFRRDLFYRLNVTTIDLPPLRDRVEDLPALAEHFLAKAGKEAGLPARTLGRGALQAFGAYPWPGNVRELENELRRLTLSGEGAVAPDEVAPRIRKVAEARPAAAAGGDAGGGGSLDDAVKAIEVGRIRAALAESRGNVMAAARALGLHHLRLRRKMERYGIAAADASGASPG